MEAGNPKRAAARLAMSVGSAALTVVLLAATAYVVTRPYPKPVSEAKPEWDVIETGESYRLPQAETPMTPVTMAPARPTPPAYAPPPTPAPVAAAEVADQPAGGKAWAGPLTIHNPAAFGPPEDDSLPPIPTPSAPALEPYRVASAPAGPSLIPPPAAPLPDWDEGLATSVATQSEPTVPHNQAAPTPVRPLREIAVTRTRSSGGYTASINGLSKRLEPEVQAGFQLGKSGAVFAARAKFVRVLRQIALAKDAQAGGAAHAEALAEGLRTLDDADDFVPRGDALEAELDVAAIAASHGLRLAQATDSPHEAVARYAQHAAERLAVAAAGEPAGSMALYGLGKSYARLEVQDEDPNAGRKSLVMYRAAIDSNAQNYLAANELGVRLARGGHYQEARQVLRVAASQPTAIATVHANLAALEQRLGDTQTAALARQHSERLAQRERQAGQVSQRMGVQWVPPSAFGGAAPQPQAPPPGQPAPAPVQTAAAPQEPKSGTWSSVVRMAKRATGWSTSTPATPQGRVAGPPALTPPQRVLR